MKRSVIVGTLLFLFLATALGGCAADGIPFSAASASLPTVQAGQGRVIFFRETGFTGSGNVARIHLNGVAVGAMPHGSVLVVDHAPGNVELMVNSALLFGQFTRPLTIEAGDELYVQIAASGQMGSVGALPYLATQSASQDGRFPCGAGWCAGPVPKEEALQKMQELKLQTASAEPGS